MAPSSSKLQVDPFKGFPARVRFTRIPAPFFSELMPQIDHLGELKITLYALWFLDKLEGNVRYLRQSDFSGDARLMQSLEPGAEQALADALQRAVGRGTLLKADLPGESGAESYYFINSPRGRAAVEAISRGSYRPTNDPRQPITLDLVRPNIYQLYEENIGPLTPMIAEELKDAEQTYSIDWIEDALRIAVENNVRRWRYIQAILRAWQEEGRDDQNRGNTEKDRQRYAQSWNLDKPR
jgi:DNA replication protein